MGKNAYGYKVYTQMPGWAKGLVVVGGLVGVGLVVRYIIKKANQAKDLEKARATLKTVDNQIATLQASVKASYSLAQYQSWADAIESCFQGWGTCNGDSFFKNMKNDLDIYLLIQAFGIRTIKSGTWNPTPDFTGNLPMAVRDEYDTIEMAMLNGTLKKNGLTYQF